MSASFEAAVAKTIIREGGATFTNDKDDPGGATKFGISKRAFPDVDIANLTESEAKAIYKKHYWDPIKGDAIESQALAENFFDTAVNMGVVTATKLVQMCLDVSVDGRMGDITLARLNAINEELFMAKFVIGKVARYASICNKNSTMKKYLLGWINRSLGAAI